MKYIIWKRKSYSWEEIYVELLEEYPEKIKPQKARKSIMDIKNSKKLVMDYWCSFI